MSTRFNTFGTTSGLATELTLDQIRDKLNDSITVEVSSLPPQGNDVNISAVANINLSSAELPTDIKKVNGNTLSTNSGNVDSGTQRVVLASDQPTINTNSTVTGSVTVSNGVVFSNTLIDSVPASNNIGNSDTGTQRVVLASDQPTLNTNSTVTGSVSVTSGTVDANITNASLNTNVTNASLNTNATIVNTNAINDNYNTADPARLILGVRKDDINNPLTIENRYTPLVTDKNNCLRVEISERSNYNLGFQSLNISQLTALLQYSFIYSVNPRLFEFANSGGGTVGIVDNHCQVANAALSGSFVAMSSKPTIHYRNGQVGVFRTALYVPSTSGTGANFSDGRNSVYWGIGSRTFSTGFRPTEGYFFGYNAASDVLFIAIRQDNAGNFNDVLVQQGNWNGIAVNINPTQGNVYQITYEWLGYGAVNFWILDPVSSYFKKVHSYRITNTSTKQSSVNPFLSASYWASSTGAGHTTAMEVRISSTALFIAGLNINNFPPRTIRFGATGISAVATYLGSIRNLQTFNTKTNYLQAFIKRITLSVINSGSNTSILNIYENSTLTAPIWASLEPNVSILETNTAGALNVKGRLIFTIPLANTTASSFNMENYFIPARDSIDFEIVPSGGTTSIEISTLIQEDL